MVNKTAAFLAKNTSSKGQVMVRVFEMRWSLSWTWLLPLLVVLMAFVITKTSFHMPSDNMQKVNGPDYASEVRRWLELFLPLATIFLTNQLLAQEWQRGTLVQLALRRSLWRVLGERLLYVLVYVSVLTFIVGLVSMVLTIDPPGDGNALNWSWQVMLTVLPSTLLLVALGLLITHITTSFVAGYIVTISFWLANLLIAPLLRAQHHEQWLIYGLNGWINRVTPEDNDWLVGKLVLLVIALTLLAMQLWILRNEARLLRSVE